MVPGRHIVDAIKQQVQTENNSCSADDYENCEYDVDQAVLVSD